MSSSQNGRLESTLRPQTDRRAASRSTTLARRSSARITGPCVAIVKTQDSTGRPYSTRTVLRDVSAGGLYLMLGRDVPVQSPIRVVFAFSTVALTGVDAPVVAVQGIVRRVEPRNGDGFGIGVEFQDHRFL
jgi:hypothetical protein